MIRGSTKIFLESVAAVALVAVVLAGFLAWRLSQGPISIDSVTRYIETALSDPASGRRVTIGESGLIWDPDDHALEVRADRVSVFDAQGQAVVVVPEMTVRFRLAALLRGIVAPKAISLIRPSLTVIRTAEGGWEFSAVPETDQGPGPAPSGDPEQIRVLVERSLSQLDGFRLLEARLVVDDRRADALWVVPRASLALQRVRGGQFDTAASLEVEIDGQAVPIRASARLGAGFELIDADLSLAAARPSAIAARVDALSDLAALDLPLGGTLHFDRNQAGGEPALSFDIAGEPGQIVRPELPGGQLPVTSLTLRGRYGVDSEDLTLDELVLGMPTTSVTLRGTARDLGGAAAIDGSVAIASLPIDDLRKYWPPEFGANARRWILANMSQGVIRDASARFSAQRVDGALDIDQVEGQLSVENTRIRYIRAQPRVEQVSGSVRFDNQHFDIAVHGGRLRGLKVDSAQLTISGLAARDQAMAMQLAVSGPVAELLALLDQPPFGYVRRFGVAPRSIGGDLTAQASLRFPLIDRLTFDEVALSATASVEGLGVPKAVRDFDLTDGRFDVNLDKAGMGWIGTAQIGGVPAAVTWDERFERPVPYRRRYSLTATVTDAQRRALGLELADYVDGPVGVTATYTEQGDRRSRLVGDLDFRDAALTIDDLGWTKPAGQPTTGRLEAGLSEGRLATLERADLTGGGITVRTSGAFGAQGRLSRLDIPELKAGATDVTGRATWSGDRMDLTLSGRSLDASALFGGDDVGGKPPRAMTVSAKFDRVLVGPTRQLAKVELSADRDGARWRSASIVAGVGAGGMTLNLTPGKGGRALSVVADDAGAVFKTFGLSDGMRGGRLRVDGRYDDAEGSPDADRLNARIGVEDYRFVRVPLLAKLLAVTSVTGIPELMTGEGIAFKELSIQLVKTPNHLEIVEGRASGLALGLTAQGTLDGPEDVADLTGTIVPVYQVNRLFEAIPVIGEIVTGGGGGLFAFTYSVKGPLDNPSITVNPLSVLAPGFLRNLFYWLPDVTPPLEDAPPPLNER
jgi:hypothetical protein